MVSETTPGKLPDSGLRQVATIHSDVVARSVNARSCRVDRDVRTAWYYQEEIPTRVLSLNLLQLSMCSLPT